MKKESIMLSNPRQLDLTQRQRDVLDYIVKVIKEDLAPPSVREIGDHFGFSSTNAVADHLLRLERKGYLLETERSRSRGIKLSNRAKGEYDLYFMNQEKPEAHADSRRLLAICESVIKDAVSGYPTMKCKHCSAMDLNRGISWPFEHNGGCLVNDAQEVKAIIIAEMAKLRRKD